MSEMSTEDIEKLFNGHANYYAGFLGLRGERFSDTLIMAIDINLEMATTKAECTIFAENAGAVIETGYNKTEINNDLTKAIMLKNVTDELAANCTAFRNNLNTVTITETAQDIGLWL